MKFNTRKGKAVPKNIILKCGSCDFKTNVNTILRDHIDTHERGISGPEGVGQSSGEEGNEKVVYDAKNLK